MDLKAQTPAQGIRLDAAYDDAVFYTVSCSCGNEEDEHAICIELDKDTKEVILNVYTKCTSTWWDMPVSESGRFYKLRRFINGFLHRVKVTWEVWTKGYVTCQTTTLLKEQAALNYGQAIIDAANHVRNK